MNYRKPPIIQAIIEFQFEGACTLANSRKIMRSLKEEYPQAELIKTVTITNEGGSVDQRIEDVGFKISSTDGLKILSLRNPELVQGPLGNVEKKAYFSATQMAPYLGWEEFLPQFLMGWEYAEKYIGHRKLNRIGLRYLNRIDIPEEDINISDWVTVKPSFPNNFKQPNASFMQILLPYEEDQALLKVGTTISPLPRHSAIVLDIDIGTIGEINSHINCRIEILKRLHKEKNEIFENCITDATRRLFGE